MSHLNSQITKRLHLRLTGENSKKILLDLIDYVYILTLSYNENTFSISSFVSLAAPLKIYKTLNFIITIPGRVRRQNGNFKENIVGSSISVFFAKLNLKRINNCLLHANVNQRKTRKRNSTPIQQKEKRRKLI